jgi:hypothetical protein
VVSGWVNACAGCAFATSLLILGGIIDGPSDAEAERDVASDYAQAVTDGGKAKCAALGREPLWTKNGDLVCRERVRAGGDK